MSTKSGNPPLKDVTVVTLEQAVAAPLCSAQLAQAGARVIKVERPEGDFARSYDNVVHGESAYFVWLNAGKESVCVNLHSEEDRDFLSRIIAKADIFIQNLAPGAAARHGFRAEVLREAHPRLITVDISGYGEHGEYAGMKAYDLLIQAETGMVSITGVPAAPGRVGVSICDIACGMYAYSAVLEALYNREKTGAGDAIKVSLFDATANWMTVPLLHQQYGGEAPRRVGLHHPSIAPYGIFTCADGFELLIAIQNEREWASFCTNVINRPDLITDPAFATNDARVRNRTELEEIIGSLVTDLDRSALIGRLRAAKIAFGQLNDIEALRSHPQLRRTEVGSPQGPVSIVSPPSIHEDWFPVTGVVPRIGQHGDAIRREFAEVEDETVGP